MFRSRSSVKLKPKQPASTILKFPGNNMITHNQNTISNPELKPAVQKVCIKNITIKLTKPGTSSITNKKSLELFVKTSNETFGPNPKDHPMDQTLSDSSIDDYIPKNVYSNTHLQKQQLEESSRSIKRYVALA